MLTWILVWCAADLLLNRAIQPVWPWAEIVLTSPFWPIILWIEFRAK